MRSSQLLLISALLALTVFPATAQDVSPAKDLRQVAFAPALGVDLDHSHQLEPGVYVRDLRTASAPTSTLGRRWTFRVRAWLPNGSPLPVGEGDTLSVQLGSGVMLPAWERAISDLTVGSVRQIILNSAHAYGKEGGPSVPPDSPIIFEVELLSAS